MDDSYRLDADSLRVLAHPLRARLLSQLRLHGPATATVLAERLSTNTGATSYHLRRLAATNLVTDTGTGTGKRRVWAAATRSHQWAPSDFDGDVEAEASLAWLERFYHQALTERIDAWTEVSHQWPASWRDTLGSGDDGVTVTAEQAKAMWEEIEAVVTRYRDAGAEDSGARRILVWTHLLPRETDPPVTGT